MIYLGSKRRIAKELLSVMLKDATEDTYFIDCFCGGGNLIQFCTKCRNKIGSDINPYTISFLNKIKDEGCEWLPKNRNEFTREDYIKVRDNKENYSQAFLGHIGYNLSYGGKWFGGFRHDNVGKRDYIEEAYKGALKQAELIKEVTFKCCSYDELGIPPRSIIYCDIPYRDCTKYSAVEEFNYLKFYSWCKEKRMKGHKVFISEYNMPSEFTCIWQKELKVQIKVNSNSIPSTEKLFTLL